MRAHLCSCVGPRANVWLLMRVTTPTFCLLLSHFLTSLCTCLGLAHPIVAHLSQCQCGHTIDDLGTHLLWHPYMSEHIIAHNTLQNTVTTIILESGAHVQREVSHLFLHHSRRQVDILIIRDNFQTLMDVVIIDLILTNMAQWTLTTIMCATMMAI
jgi:hypothetical protein